MKPDVTIRAQLNILQQELLRARSSIELPDLDPDLRGRVAARFDKALTRLQAETESLSMKVAGSQPLNACWQELQQTQQKAGRVFDECLAFIHGGLARKFGLDHGMCALGDALLDDLARWSDVPWGRFTLLGGAEVYRDMAEIIRLRYPEASFWSLPLASHEFGHFVGPQLRQSQDDGHVYPFQDLLRAADKDRRTELHTEKWYHLQEHFADAFATYTLGPAYAAALILLRLYPSQAYVNELTHPSGARRVHGILCTLERMDKRDATLLRRPYFDAISILRASWQASLQEVGQAGSLNAAEAALIQDRTEKLVDLIINLTPQQLAFTLANWQRAEQFAANLSPDKLPSLMTRRDVLNAAWLRRLAVADQDMYALNAIVEPALAVYRTLPAL